MSTIASLVRLVVAVTAVVGAGDGTTPKALHPTRADVSAQMMELLARRTGGVVVAGDRGGLRLGARTLRLHAVVDRELTHGDKAIASVDVRCEIDGSPVEALRSGSVGVDDSRDAAVSTAVGEWVVQYGVPIAAALGAKGAGGPEKWLATALRAGPFTVYTGPVGIRGEAPPEIKTGADADMHRRFLRELEPSLSSLLPPGAAGLHAFTLTLVIHGSAPTEGECRVDGEVSERLCAVARRFAWPRPATNYMLKQYFVLSASRESLPSRARAGRP